MKLKSLLFGSAAGIVAITGAQAADLPVAEPVEYVRICDAFGEGFFYIPGTETCLEIGGYARFDMSWSDRDFGNEDDYNNLRTRARGNVHFDAMTATELGTLRGYVEFQLDSESPRNADTYQFDNENFRSSSESLEYAFTQLVMNNGGTITAGLSDSTFYTAFDTNLNISAGDDDPTGAVNRLAYTQAFGNGFSATIALEDPQSTNAGPFRTGGDLEDGYGYDLAGQRLPDLVGTIAVDQAWGSAYLSGIVGEIRAEDRFIGDPDVESEMGWGVAAGATASFGIINAGLAGAFSEGLPGRVTNDIAFFDADDFGGDLELSTAWQVRGNLGAKLTSTLSANLTGTYAEFENDNLAGDATLWTAAANLYWRPVSGLLVAGEIGYESRDVSGDFEDITSDGDVWSIQSRIQRSF